MRTGWPDSPSPKRSRLSRQSVKKRRVFRAEQRSPQQVHRDRRRALPDVGAVARQERVRVSVGPSASITEKHTVPTGFSLRAAARPGDSGDRDGGVGAEALQRTARPSPRPPARTPPRAFRSASASTSSSSDFRLVGVGHHTAGHVVRRPRPVGQPRRDQPRGARLRGRNPAAGQQLARPDRRRSEPSSEKSWRACLFAQQLDQLRIHVGAASGS